MSDGDPQGLTDQPAMPASGGGNFSRRVEALAAEIASGISAERIRRAMAEALTPAGESESGAAAVQQALAERISAVFGEFAATADFSARVAELSRQAAGELVDPGLAARIQAVPDETRVRELAAEAASGALRERLDAALREALAALPGEDRVRAIAREESAAGMGDALERRLSGGEFSDRVRDLAASAADAAVAAAVDTRLAGLESRLAEVSAAGDVRAEIESGLASRISAALEEFTASGRMTSRVLDLVRPELEKFGGTMAGAVTTEQLEERLSGLREAQESAREAAEALQGSLSEIRAALPEAISQAARAARGEAEEAAGQKIAAALSGEPFAARVRKLAAETSGGGLRGEDVKPLVGEVLAEALPGIMAGEEFAARQRDAIARCAGELLADRLPAALAGQFESEEFRARATEIAAAAAAEALGGRLAELEAALAERPRAEDIRAELAPLTEARTGTEQSLSALREAQEGLSSALDSLRGDLEGKADGAVLEERAAGLEARAGELNEQVSALRDAQERLSSALESLRGDLEGKVGSGALEERAAGLEARAGELDERVSSLAADLEKNAARTSGVEEKLGDGPEAAARRVLEEEGLGAETLSGRITRAAREVAADVFSARVTKVEQELEERVRAAELEKAVDDLRGKTASAEDLERRAGELESARGALEKRLTELSESLAKLRAEMTEADEEAGQLAEKISIEEEKSGALGVLLGGILKIHLRLERLDMSLERLADAASVQADIEEITNLVKEAREKLSATTGTERIGDMAEEVLEDAMERVREIESELAEARGEVRLRALIREETGGMGKEDLLAQSEEQLRDIVVEMIRSGELHKQLKTIVRRSTERRTADPAAQAMSRGRWLTVKDEGEALGAGPEVEDAEATNVDELLQRVVSSDDFKIALDERFRTMLEYLKTDAIPRQFKKLMKEQQG